jgi:hypothetical protein
MQDHNDIYSIVERLRMLEEGLDKNQRSVNQLSATFKPKTVAVLTAKTDPKNPMAGKLVGGSESIEREEESLEEEASEDILSKVKKSFADYLKNIADEIKTDPDLKDRTQNDTDLKKKEKNDRDLVAKKQPVAEQGTDSPETEAVKVLALDNGNICEVHGDDSTGFEIRHGNRKMKSKFKTLEEAELALEMFNAHLRARPQDETQDYIDEA